MPRVLNQKTATPDELKDAIYVGRPTMFGNPFYMYGERSRQQTVDLYRQYLVEHPALADTARQLLRGKDLVCWCAPKACHADILLELANADPPQI